MYDLLSPMHSLKKYYLTYFFQYVNVAQHEDVLVVCSTKLKYLQRHSLWMQSNCQGDHPVDRGSKNQVHKYTGLRED